MALQIGGSGATGAFIGGVSATAIFVGGTNILGPSPTNLVDGLYSPSPTYVDATPSTTAVNVPVTTTSGRSLVFVYAYSNFGVSGESITASVPDGTATLIGTNTQGRSNTYCYDVSVAAGSVTLVLTFQSTPRAIAADFIDIGASTGIGATATIAGAADNADFNITTQANGSRVYAGLTRANASGVSFVWSGTTADTGDGTTGGGTGSSDNDFSLGYSTVSTAGAYNVNCVFDDNAGGTSSLQYCGVIVEVLQ